MGVIDVEMNAPEYTLDLAQVGGQAIDKEFADFILSDLAGNQQLFIGLVSSGPQVFVGAFELDGDGSLFDSRAAFFVDDFSDVGLQPQHFLIGASQQELDGVEDVTFA